ncbi:MAG: cation transporter [Gemmatimonadaceae bacterium]|nr:cation transporter [Gemmatimonadaceae bacterium]
MTSPAVDLRAASLRRGRILNLISLAYNAVEAVIAMSAGAAAGSIALVGFGVDSLLELGASLAATWRLTADRNPVSRERVEFIALRLTGASFVGLALYVGVESIQSLRHHEIPGESTIGLVLALFSAVIMPPLSRAKRRVAEDLGSGALAAEAQQTMLCSYLSWILLIGLAANALLGWWWADPVAALAMVPIIGKEGWEALRGRSSCACHVHSHPH